MRTIEADVAKILSELDRQFRQSMQGTKIADFDLATFTFMKLFEETKAGASLDEVMDGIFVGMSTMPIPQEYLKHLLGACAYSVSAIRLYLDDNEIEAWQKVADSKSEAGCALAIFVSSSEGKQSRDEQAQRVKNAEILVKEKLSAAGLQGAELRKKNYEPFKSWVRTEAKRITGSDKDIARNLSRKLPPDLAHISKDPERLIYDTLREDSKATKSKKK